MPICFDVFEQDTYSITAPQAVSSMEVYLLWSFMKFLILHQAYYPKPRLVKYTNLCTFFMNDSFLYDFFMFSDVTGEDIALFKVLPAWFSFSQKTVRILVFCFMFSSVFLLCHFTCFCFWSFIPCHLIFGHLSYHIVLFWTLWVIPWKLVTVRVLVFFFYGFLWMFAQLLFWLRFLYSKVVCLSFLTTSALIISLFYLLSLSDSQCFSSHQLLTPVATPN